MKIKRISVAAFFFVNGFLYANWTSRIPELQSFFELSNSELGTLLFIHAAGALLAMPFAGGLVARFGSVNITRVAAFLFCVIIALLVLFQNVWIAAIFFFLLGAASGATDVAMNGQAVFVERLYARPIMSSFHAVFSIGMALGAASGALFTNLSWALFPHLLLTAIVGIIILLLAGLNLVNDAPDLSIKNTTKRKAFVLPTQAILPLGIIAFCGMTGEGSMADWSALFMNKVVGNTEFMGAVAFGTFATAMTLARIFGDYFTLKLGKRKLLIFDGFIAIIGLSMALFFASTWMTLVGFFLIGLGLATIVPIIYSTAGNIEGVEPSTGIAMATTIGYTGFFVGPPTIGFLSDYFGLRLGLCFTLFLFFIMLLFILNFKKRNAMSLLKGRDF
jgi:MFS family permease